MNDPHSELFVLFLVPIVLVYIILKIARTADHKEKLANWCRAQEIEHFVITKVNYDTGPYWSKKGYSIFRIEGTQRGSSVTFYARKGWSWELREKLHSGEYRIIPYFQV